MNICYIFHSETGNTSGIADRCRAATGGDRVGVKDLQHYNRITKFLVGGRRAGKGLLDPIEPATIDVAKHDLVVVGSPVWAGKPTPAVNAAIQALKGCEGKKAVLFVTCGGSPGESLALMQKALEARGITVRASASFSRKELHDEGKLNGLVQQIKAAV
jgi:NAD(P)H-dependent FMN reductase